MRSDIQNQTTYAQPKTLNYYNQLSELFPCERVLLESLRQELEGAKVLDIGIGGGRTTQFLLPIAKDYIGVDYVPEYIKLAKEKYGAENFLEVDARDLNLFADESFDFVLFSYNGIDAVNHEDRKRVLNEINRVLRKGGLFMFSSHNRQYEYLGKPYWMRHGDVRAVSLKNLLSYFVLLPRHLWMKKYEVFTSEYTIINDSDHRYSMLIYYIDISSQLDQLEHAGFKNLGAYSATGKLVTNDTKSLWIYYLAQKKPAHPGSTGIG